MQVRALERSELGEAASTLALAFDDDPLFRHLLPRAASRRAWIRWFHLRALTECLAVGGAFTLAGGPAFGAIGLYPPGAWPPKLANLLRATTMVPGPPPYRLLTEGLWIEREIHRLHPPGPHLYVYVLGVHPEQKGRGLGGALLRHAASIARAAGVVGHLETSNPQNLSLYRRFGYEVQRELGARGVPPVWTMTTASTPGG